ncbi:MAG: exodeoxyribonuclease VII large subunit [Proteobacteria bacterium]|nr:MAG: exodeoxyribonuclease VII large subunit [Pseudomonadota bacterium]
MSGLPEQGLIFSISQLNAEVSLLLGQCFPAIWIEGEISNLARPSSRHLYFSLKDEQAQVRCALFRHRNLALRIRPENGMHIIAKGKVALYEPRGDYQFIIEQIETAGEGLLQRRFEALKHKLLTAGWFNTEHKKSLPPLPRAIGVITSPTGAAVRDILNVLKRRCPHIPVWIYPVTVQGETAARQIVRALQQANQEQRCDTLILARGGGSLEDLWPFNEEAVATAIYQSHLPIITGIGHETDFTIADFVADQRAPTPSAAAELAAPEAQALRQQLRLLSQRLQQQLALQLQYKQQQLHSLQHRLNLQKPANRLRQQAQKLDELDLRLHRQIQHYLHYKQDKLQTIKQTLLKSSPLPKIHTAQQNLQQQAQYLQHLMQLNLASKQKQLALQAARLNAYSPLATLERGFAVVFDQNHQVLRQAENTTNGSLLTVRLHKGELLCRVEECRTEKKIPTSLSRDFKE